MSNGPSIDCPKCGANRIRPTVSQCEACEIAERYEAAGREKDLEHDAETKANLQILQECVNKACKPGRQIRGVAVVLVDANGDAARIVSVSPRYGVTTIGFLEILKHDCIAGLE